MSFNLWHGGDAGGQPLAQTVAVIKASKADVVGLQETAGNAPEGEERPDNAAELAKLLGWNYFDQGGRTGIISRLKIVSGTEKKWGVKLETPSGRQFYLFNAHFNHAPYQPYQLLRIPYAGAPFLSTEAEAIQAARDARGDEVERMLGEVKPVLGERLPVFITGDFNEPSYLDWTKEVAEADLSPLSVKWPTTKAISEAGFEDTYRSVHPDPIQNRGLTWTPITKISDPNDRHDRIDFVFAGGAKVHVKQVQVIGEEDEYADIVVRPYPSDHRAVCAEVELATEESDNRVDQLSVMTWNIWHGGREDGETIGPQRVVEVIQKQNVDVVAMQETYSSGEWISEQLGYHFHPRGTNVSLHSRFPIIEDLSVIEEFKCVGALLELPNKQRVAVFSIWLPYDAEIWETGTRNVDDPQSMLAACNASEKDLKQLWAAIAKRMSGKEYAGIPIIIAGDFNSMSHLDYTSENRDQYQVAIDWPTSHILIDQGFSDSYRELNPQVDRNSDRTWTPRFPKQEQDRIDFIYYRGDSLRPLSSRVIDQHAQQFPSDHAAVLTRFQIAPSEAINK